MGDTIHEILGGPKSVRAYGCVQCQKWHYMGDQEFWAHIRWQSKHGTTHRPATEAADTRACAARSDPTGGANAE